MQMPRSANPVGVHPVVVREEYDPDDLTAPGVFDLRAEVARVDGQVSGRGGRDVGRRDAGARSCRGDGRADADDADPGSAHPVPNPPPAAPAAQGPPAPDGDTTGPKPQAPTGGPRHKKNGRKP